MTHAADSFLLTWILYYALSFAVILASGWAWSRYAVRNFKKKNMKNLFLILTLMAFTSCMTINRIKRNCDTFYKVCVNTEREVVYRDTVIYRTDTIRVKLPSDTVTITDTVRVVNNLAFLPPIHRRFGLIATTAGVNNSILSVQSWLTDSTFLVPHSDTIFIEKAIKEETTTNVVPVKYIPKAYKYTFWIVVIQIIALLAVVGWSISRYYRPQIRGILSAIFTRNGK